MNRLTYRVMCEYAGPALLASFAWPVALTLPFPLAVTSAVYIVVDARGRCHYVGSVRRANGGLGSRLAEHLADAKKRSTWHAAWVIPLRPETPEAEVRRIEGVIGAHLGPYASRQLPVPKPPPTVRTQRRATAGR